MIIALTFENKDIACAPDIGDHFRVGGFVGDCVDRDECFDEAGNLICINVFMRSEQKPLCEFCKHAGAETTDDVACCNCCSEADDEQCFFMPWDFCGWLNELLRRERSEGIFPPS